VPLDPGRHWLEAGITGLPRQREWDVVVTTEATGNLGDEVELVVLPDGRLLVESGPDDFDPVPLAAALEGRLEPPYRAVGVRRPELWVVGARSIEVARLEPNPRGNELELTWSRSTLALVVDGMPADPSAADALERIARGRQPGAYSAHAHRLDADLWELRVLPL
jgi:hypothetical protein